MKSKEDKLDIDILALILFYSSKLSDVVRNDVFKKDVYNAKIKSIEDKTPDITNVATNATPNAKINEVKNEIPIITNLPTINTLNDKINDAKNKIPSITNLATTAAFTLLGIKCLMLII